MFPIRDDNPQLLTPYATYALIALNVVAWGALQGFGTDPALSRSVCQLGLIPGELFASFSEPPVQGYCPSTGNGGWLDVLTSMFMHGGWMHIIGNLWFLFIFGGNVEDAMGSLRFVIFYLLCGVAAAAAQIATDPSSPIPMVGASGAIGGVMGAYIVLYPRVHVHMLVFLGFLVTTFAVPAFVMLGYWIAVQFLGTLTDQEGGGVAFWAHIGGFLAGAILVWLFKVPRLLRAHPHHGWRRDTATRAWHRVD